MEFSSPQELLTMFSIDCESAGANYFCLSVEYLTLYSVFTQYNINYSDIIYYLLKYLHVSHKVFWSSMKSRLRPILSENVETLAALGIPTTYLDGSASALVRAVAAALADAKFERITEYCGLAAECSVDIIAAREARFTQRKEAEK